RAVVRRRVVNVADKGEASLIALRQRRGRGQQVGCGAGRLEHGQVGGSSAAAVVTAAAIVAVEPVAPGGGNRGLVGVQGRRPGGRAQTPRRRICTGGHRIHLHCPLGCPRRRTRTQARLRLETQVGGRQS